MTEETPMTDHRDPRRIDPRVAEKLEDELDRQSLREAIAADDGTRISSAELLRLLDRDAQTPADGTPPAVEHHPTA